MKNLATHLTSAFIVLSLVGCTNASTSTDTSSIPSDIADDFEKQAVSEIQKEPRENTDIEPDNKEIVLFRGSYFDIEYPQNFIARSVEDVPHETINEAYFASPDGAVELYVFSPLWRGEPQYLTISPLEELVSEKTEESGSGLEKKIIRWVTLQAKDGSYYRSYVSIKEQVDSGSDLHHVFGFKYRDKEAYEQYQNAYLFFKNSLRQYAD